MEAETAPFKNYGKQIVKNAKTLAAGLTKGGLKLVTGGTECHLMVVDLRPIGLSGNVVAEALEAAGIVVNRNSVPNDPAPPFYPSGIRLGTPGLTTRGMKEGEMRKIAGWILKIVEHVKNQKLPEDKEKRSVFMMGFRDEIGRDKDLRAIAIQVKALCRKFPTP